MSYKTWMTENRFVLQNKPLSGIKLLGTHDSATYGLKLTDMPPCSPDAEETVMKLLLNPCLKGPVTAITVPWARCQEHTVYEQLCRGVRFLDLRLAIKTEFDAGEYKEKIAKTPDMTFTKEEIWTCHSVYASPLSEVVADIERFFNELPADHCETLIIDVQSVDGFLDRHHQFLLDHVASIRKWFIRRDTDMCECMATVWADPMQRIYFLHRKAGDVPVLEGDHMRPRGWFLYSKWNESNTPEMLVGKLKDLLSLTGPIKSCLPVQQMCVTQGVMTATGSDIVKGFLCCCCGSPSNVEDFAKQVNSHVLELWENFDPATAADPSRDHRNILLLDFFEHGRSPKGLCAMDLIITLNGGTVKTEPFAQ